MFPSLHVIFNTLEYEATVRTQSYIIFHFSEQAEEEEGVPVPRTDHHRLNHSHHRVPPLNSEPLDHTKHLPQGNK